MARRRGSIDLARDQAMKFNLRSVWFAIAGVVALAGCERPPVDVVQRGYRGTGMQQVYNPRTVEKVEASGINVAPAVQPEASGDGPKAKDVYKNVQVLGDLSVGQFTRHMVAITAWVSPEQGCTYCHNPANFAEDNKYTKIVARRMIQMTQHVNEDWKTHVADTGVTCYTCHRGNPVPNNVWFTSAPAKNGKLFLGNDHGQNKPSPSVGLSTLPYDPFTKYLLGDSKITVGGKTALPTGNEAGTKDAEGTYALMMHMSGQAGLGVNCTYCHNAQHFPSYDTAPPQKVTAWHGIRMVRDLNKEYMVPLTATFPDNRKGELGDVAKQNCGTCHQGAYKPLNGAAMAKDYPELQKKLLTTVAAPAAAAIAPAAAVAAEAPVGVLGKVLFDTGKTELGADGTKEVAGVAEIMKKNAGLTVNISGFADSRGSLEKNMELSKLRAFAVRDGLKAAGIEEARIILKKPEAAVAGGSEADARRVEISSVK
jgi:photosynthetic reaction center cytochrome c subunit